MKRLKTELGCYFVGGWHAYVRHHATGNFLIHDPLKHDTEFTTGFLNHIMECDGDIRIAMRRERVAVDWWEVEREGKKGAKGHSKGTGKDTGKDGKRGGKRPRPSEDQQWAPRQRQS